MLIKEVESNKYKRIIKNVYKEKFVFDEAKVVKKDLIYRYRYNCAGQITNGTKTINLNDFIEDCKLWLYNLGYKVIEEYNKISLYTISDIFVVSIESTIDENFVPYEKGNFIELINLFIIKYKGE